MSRSEKVFCRKPRLRTSSQYLLEALNGIYFALFNDAPELAVQAVDAVHQRALYEFYADVILVCFIISPQQSITVFNSFFDITGPYLLLQVTNSISNSLLESNLQKNDELLTAHWVQHVKLDNHKEKEVVRNASVRLKKMPEDISPVDDTKFNFSDSKLLCSS